MSDPKPRMLDPVGSLFRRANERRALLEATRLVLDELETGGRVVTGERALWDTAAELHQRALAALERVGDDRLEDLLHTADACLAREEWDVLEETKAELQGACEAQRGAVDKIRELISGLVVPLRDALQAIEEARLALAPTRDAQRMHTSTTTLIDQVKADLTRLPAAALARRAELEQARPALERLTTELRDASARARLHLRHSELVMIRTQGDELDDYSVLLRTPAEPGAHGVHVRGTSTLVPKDRELVFEALESVSKTLLSGARREQPVTVPMPVQTIAPAPASATSVDGETRGGLPPPPSAASSIANAEASIADLGDLMFKLFLPEQMQQYLRRTPCAITLTTNDLDMPWELMKFDDEVFCLDRCVGRMPMGNTFPRLDRPQPLNNQRVRFLLICADDNGKLTGAREEIDRIYAALDQLQKDRTKDPSSTNLPVDVEVLSSPNVDCRTLNRKLRYESYNVIHFAGHARFDTKQPDRSALLLDNGEVFLAQKIRRLLVGRPLVFLNACDSARTPVANAEAGPDSVHTLSTYLQEPAEGLAASFLYGGALGCIGSLWPVYDIPASEFAIAFYRYVLAGHVIGEAMRLARREVRQKHPQHLTWATFVLYGNPTFVLQS